MNVVKGLKMYEEIFMESELSKLLEFITQLRASGRNGNLSGRNKIAVDLKPSSVFNEKLNDPNMKISFSGETFMFFNKQLKGNKREVIQLGAPIFQSTKEEETSKSN